MQRSLPGARHSEEAEMHTQRTRRRIAQEQRLTHYDELEARSTMSRRQLAVMTASTGTPRPRRSAASASMP